MKTKRINEIYDCLIKDMNMSLTDIGNELSLTRERIRQIVEREFLRYSELYKNIDLKSKVLLYDSIILNSEDNLDKKFLIALFLKKFKYKYKDGIIYKSSMKVMNKDIINYIYSFLKNEITDITFNKDKLVSKLDYFSKNLETKSFITNKLLENNYLIKSKEGYSFNPEKNSCTNNFILIEINSNFKEFSLKRDSEKLIKILKEKYDKFRDLSDIQLKKTIRGVTVASKKVFLINGATFSTKLKDPKNDYSEIIKYLKIEVEEKGLYSLQIFWKKNAESLSKDFDSLQSFYTYLRFKTDILCPKYPIISNEENYNKFKIEKLKMKEMFRIEENNRKPKEIRSFFGLNFVSYRQFFKK